MTSTYKLNPLGQRCDMKMTSTGRVACTHPRCQRKATTYGGHFDRSWHGHFRCDNPAHHGDISEIKEHNGQGYMAYSAMSGTFGMANYVAKWQDREVGPHLSR